MPLLLECARVRGPDYLTQMWHFMCDALIKAIGTEPDSDVLSEIMHAFAKVPEPPPYGPISGPPPLAPTPPRGYGGGLQSDSTD